MLVTIFTMFVKHTVDLAFQYRKLNKNAHYIVVLVAFSIANKRQSVPEYTAREFNCYDSTKDVLYLTLYVSSNTKRE